MACDPRTIAFVVGQAAAAGVVRAKPMFGEHALYCDDRLVALLFDDRLFVKPTPAGRAFAPDAAEDAPYPGAKPWLVIDGEHWDEAEWLAELMRLTAAALPLPRPRAGRRAKPARDR